MNRASKWFRNLFAGKKSDPTTHRPKKKWPFPLISKSRGRKVKEKEKEKNSSESAAHKPQQQSIEGHGGSLTGGPKYSVAYVSPRGGTAVGYRNLRWAVVTIQSHFRAYLSRRALRALKALVKLQALVRGHILRKQMGNVMRQMEALARAQARAQIGRVLNSQVQRQLSTMLSHFNHTTGPATPQRMIEVDSFRLESTPRRRRRMSHSSDLSCCPSFSTSKDFSARQTTLSGEVKSFHPLKHDAEDNSIFYTPDSSPQAYSSGSSRRGGVYTPNKSESSRSRLSTYSNHPNYMAYTESSKAKVRSFSAPKQRPNYEHKASALQAIFAHKAYPGSGRLDRLAMP